VIESVETNSMATIASLRGAKPLIVDGTVMSMLARDFGPNMHEWAGREIALGAHRGEVSVRGLPVVAPRSTVGDTPRANYAQAGRHSPWR
jgi:hypothetical protein